MTKIFKFSPILLTLGLLPVSLPAFAVVTATPTLNSPYNGQQNWLFNNNESFRWAAITGATYYILVSDNPSFSGFTSNTTGGGTCNSSCFIFSTTQVSALKTNFANFWWKAGTYYWSVRARTSLGGVGGWAPYRSFTTTSLPAIANNARNAAGNSPQSISGGWYTDFSLLPGQAVSDGQRVRTAISTFSNWVNTKFGGYAKWVNSGRPAAPDDTVQPAMRLNLSSTYTYYSDQDSLVKQIMARFAGYIPTSDDATLALLQIRAQCKEFADRMVLSGGGIPKPYSSTATPYPRPGMYAFKGSVHSAIITEVKYDGLGTAYARLAESNYGNGSVQWWNPQGQVPWLRTVTVGREVALGSTYTAVATN